MKKPNATPDELYTVPETAKLLGIDRRTLRRYTQAGNIRSHIRKCDNRIVYNPRESKIYDLSKEVFCQAHANDMEIYKDTKERYSLPSISIQLIISCSRSGEGVFKPLI